MIRVRNGNRKRIKKNGGSFLETNPMLGEIPFGFNFIPFKA